MSEKYNVSFPESWPKNQIDANILSKLPANQVKGSAWDPKSIMEYEFGPGLVLQPSTYKNGIYPPGILSANDIKGVKSFYPVSSKITVKLTLNKSAAIKARSGGQDDFIFTAPATRKYTFQTVGQQDTVMVISEKAETENYYLSGDDDSGLDKNSKITLPLVKGREYLVNLRVMFSEGGEQWGDDCKLRGRGDEGTRGRLGRGGECRGGPVWPSDQLQ